MNEGTHTEKGGWVGMEKSLEPSTPPPSPHGLPNDEEEARIARLTDAMAVGWGRMPDYIGQRLDGWQRTGSTLAQIEEAFDQTERRRMEVHRGALEDPLAYMHTRVRSITNGDVGTMKSARTALQPAAAPVPDTHDPDAKPPRMVWVRTNAPCGTCDLQRKGARASQVATLPHSCGEMQPYAWRVIQPLIEERREEARREGECRLCWGNHYLWSYEATDENTLVLGGRRATFRDRRGSRGLVECVCIGG